MKTLRSIISTANTPHPRLIKSSQVVDDGREALRARLAEARRRLRGRLARAAWQTRARAQLAIKTRTAHSLARGLLEQQNQLHESLTAAKTRLQASLRSVLEEILESVDKRKRTAGCIAAALKRLEMNLASEIRVHPLHQQALRQWLEQANLPGPVRVVPDESLPETKLVVSGPHGATDLDWSLR